eukprot:gnl/Chilomastix_cuspidata/1021.p1 GENE.gnl/Chilomastix_cuspidata/1021~~gnl/Chilomastix_cuspidata/1021.p1  ORF type:complete len:1220 (+),score=437.16 gnl/Chilomastix_cuspidata/1021:1843-5502(+)
MHPDISKLNLFLVHFLLVPCITRSLGSLFFRGLTGYALGVGIDLINSKGDKRLFVLSTVLSSGLFLLLQRVVHGTAYFHSTCNKVLILAFLTAYVLLLRMVPLVTLNPDVLKRLTGHRPNNLIHFLVVTVTVLLAITAFAVVAEILPADVARAASLKLLSARLSRELDAYNSKDLSVSASLMFDNFFFLAAISILLFHNSFSMSLSGKPWTQRKARIRQTREEWGERPMVAFNTDTELDAAGWRRQQHMQQLVYGSSHISAVLCIVASVIVGIMTQMSSTSIGLWDPELLLIITIGFNSVIGSGVDISLAVVGALLGYATTSVVQNDGPLDADQGTPRFFFLQLFMLTIFSTVVRVLVLYNPIEAHFEELFKIFVRFLPKDLVPAHVINDIITYTPSEVSQGIRARVGNPLDALLEHQRLSGMDEFRRITNLREMVSDTVEILLQPEQGLHVTASTIVASVSSASAADFVCLLYRPARDECDMSFDKFFSSKKTRQLIDMVQDHKKSVASAARTKTPPEFETSGSYIDGAISETEAALSSLSMDETPDNAVCHENEPYFSMLFALGNMSEKLRAGIPALFDSELFKLCESTLGRGATNVKITWRDQEITRAGAAGVLGSSFSFSPTSKVMSPSLDTSETFPRRSVEIGSILAEEDIVVSEMTGKHRNIKTILQRTPNEFLHEGFQQGEIVLSRLGDGGGHVAVMLLWTEKVEEFRPEVIELIFILSRFLGIAVGRTRMSQILSKEHKQLNNSIMSQRLFLSSIQKRLNALTLYTQSAVLHLVQPYEQWKVSVLLHYFMRLRKWRTYNDLVHHETHRHCKQVRFSPEQVCEASARALSGLGAAWAVPVSSYVHHVPTFLIGCAEVLFDVLFTIAFFALVGSAEITLGCTPANENMILRPSKLLLSNSRTTPGKQNCLLVQSKNALRLSAATVEDEPGTVWIAFIFECLNEVAPTPSNAHVGSPRNGFYPSPSVSYKGSEESYIHSDEHMMMPEELSHSDASVSISLSQSSSKERGANFPDTFSTASRFPHSSHFRLLQKYAKLLCACYDFELTRNGKRVTLTVPFRTTAGYPEKMWPSLCASPFLTEFENGAGSELQELMETIPPGCILLLALPNPLETNAISMSVANPHIFVSFTRTAEETKRFIHRKRDACLTIMDEWFAEELAQFLKTVQNVFIVTNSPQFAKTRPNHILRPVRRRDILKCFRKVFNTENTLTESSM